MTTYLDASLVVALFAPEAASPAAREWAGRQRDDGLATSAWVSAEVASALSAKVRSRALTSSQRESIASQWRRFRTGLIDLPIEVSAFDTAERWVARHELTLRAADALHLAIAAAHDSALATLDRRMAEAATALGVSIAAI